MPGTTTASFAVVESLQAFRTKLLTLADLDANGVYTIEINASPARGAILELDDGLVLSGLKVTESGFDFTTHDAYQSQALYVRTRVGSSATLKHEAAAPGIADQYKLRVEGTAADLVVSSGTLLRLVYDQVAQRWAVYAPSTSAGASPAVLRAHVFGTTADPSKSTATWTTLDEMAVASVAVANGDLDVAFEGTFFADPTLGDPLVAAQLRYLVDGAPVANSVRSIRWQTATLLSLTPGEAYINVALPTVRLTGLGATADVAVQWSVTTGTLTAVGTERSLRVVQPSA